MSKFKCKIDVDSHGQQHIIFNNDCVINSIIAKGNKTLLININYGTNRTY